MNLSSLAEQKAELRQHCYTRRLGITGIEAETAATAVAAEIRELIDVAGGVVVSAYWPLEGELDPRPALLSLMQRGAVGALPRVVGDGQPLEFHKWQPDDALIEGRFKVMEPDAAWPRAIPAILLVPLVAFDRHCHRLGHGKGYYDRTLQRLRAHVPTTLSIGVAFAAQEVAHVPTDAFDQTLDLVVTERSVHRPTI